MADKPTPTYASAQLQAIIASSTTVVVLCRAAKAGFGGIAARTAGSSVITGASGESTGAVAGVEVTPAVVPGGVDVVCSAVCCKSPGVSAHWYSPASVDRPHSG